MSQYQLQLHKAEPDKMGYRMPPLVH